MRVRVVLASVASVGAIALAASCGDPKPDLFVARYDAGAPSDAAKDVDGETVDPTLGGPCVDDTQCNDGVDCTYDRCDKAILRCRNVPDDAQCGNGVFCDGIARNAAMPPARHATPIWAHTTLLFGRLTGRRIAMPSQYWSRCRGQEPRDRSSPHAKTLQKSLQFRPSLVVGTA